MRAPLGIALAALLVATGCSHVGREELRDELDVVRSEMELADSALEDRLGSRIDALDARLTRLDAEMRSALEELGAEVDRLDGSLRVHTPVHFGFDEATLPEDQLPVLDRLGAVLVEYYPNALLTVEGFTDPAGSSAYNLRLGMERARAVVGYLSRTGLDGRQMRAVSYGEDTQRLVRPGAQGPGEAGRENRRVVVVIDHPGAWTPAVTQDAP